MCREKSEQDFKLDFESDEISNALIMRNVKLSMFAIILVTNLRIKILVGSMF